jgi:hypothetical protein
MAPGAPVVWLGHDWLWQLVAGAARFGTTWRPLADAAASAAGAATSGADAPNAGPAAPLLPWRALLRAAGGRALAFPAVGKRLGLGAVDDATVRALHGLILAALAERLGAAPVLVVPPQRAPMFERLRGAAPIAGILLEPALLAAQLAERGGASAAVRAERDGYVLDWHQPERRVLPLPLLDGVAADLAAATLALPPVAGGRALPALLSIADYRAGAPRPLALLSAAPAEADAPVGGDRVAPPAQWQLTPVTDGTLRVAPDTGAIARRDSGLGLVWCWGFGEEMWQQALPPQALPEQTRADWRIAFGPGLAWQLQALGADGKPVGEPRSGTLLPPLPGDAPDACVAMPAPATAASRPTPSAPAAVDAGPPGPGSAAPRRMPQTAPVSRRAGGAPRRPASGADVPAVQAK